MSPEQMIQNRNYLYIIKVNMIEHSFFPQKNLCDFFSIYPLVKNRTLSWKSRKQIAKTQIHGHNCLFTSFITKSVSRSILLILQNCLVRISLSLIWLCSVSPHPRTSFPDYIRESRKTTNQVKNNLNSQSVGLQS